MGLLPEPSRAEDADDEGSDREQITDDDEKVPSPVSLEDIDSRIEATLVLKAPRCSLALI